VAHVQDPNALSTVTQTEGQRTPTLEWRNNPRFTLAPNTAPRLSSPEVVK